MESKDIYISAMEIWQEDTQIMRIGGDGYFYWYGKKVIDAGDIYNKMFAFLKLTNPPIFRDPPVWKEVIECQDGKPLKIIGVHIRIPKLPKPEIITVKYNDKK